MGPEETGRARSYRVLGMYVNPFKGFQKGSDMNSFLFLKNPGAEKRLQRKEQE